MHLHDRNSTLGKPVNAQSEAKSFYDREFAQAAYTPVEAHASGMPALDAFVREHGLSTKKCLEIGCGRGVYQNLVADWTGIDLSDSVREYIKKPFVQGSASELPFADSSFDGVWSIWVFEHVPEVEKALNEVRRVLKPGGVLFFSPAWQCRSWFADGYPVRPYSDFGLKGKLIKASIPVRNSVLYRSMFMFPRRVWRGAALMTGGRLRFDTGRSGRTTRSSGCRTRTRATRWIRMRRLCGSSLAGMRFCIRRQG